MTSVLAAGWRVLLVPGHAMALIDELVVIIYLVVIDIRIVDCHMYPGEPCPPSHVLSYILAEA